MDTLATNTLAAIKGGKPVEIKLKQLTELKAEIKHRHCPENAVAPLFEAIRLSISTPHLTDAGFSTLGHLMKRLELQNQHAHLQSQGLKTYPCLLERLADQKERIRQRAAQALTDFHAVDAQDVEAFLRDHVLTGRNSRAKEAGIQWVASTRKEKNIQFRAFVPSIVDCLEDADGGVRRTAQETLIELFQNANPRGINDLQKHMLQRNVRKSITEHILAELGIGTSADTDSPTAHEQVANEAARHAQNLGGSTASDPTVEAPPMSISEQEAVQLEPLYIESGRDLEETFREMQPYFEGKESEGNWLKREKSILKLRKVTKGNAPQDLGTLFISCIKGLLDGILKTVNSLRTTVSTLGCHLVQDLARVVGPGLDGMVEILLQNLIKLCGNTKKITAAKGNDTVNAVLSHVSYHARLAQHVYAASQDKNVQPRSFACGWLKIIINKHGQHKGAIEHAGGLDVIEKCLKAGLVDRDPSVRESMRPTYWAFARRWPDKSEIIMSALDPKHQQQLIKDSSNPNPEKAPPTHTAAADGRPAFSKSTTSVPTKPSIREVMAAQKRAAREKNLPSRPGSAEPFSSPKKSAAQQGMGRSTTAMSTSASRNVSNASVGTLSSAPVRPRRRADLARPATADPYANRKPIKTETPPKSPAASPAKRPKTPAPSTNTVRLAPRKVDSPAGTSPVRNGSTNTFGFHQGARVADSNKNHEQPAPSPTRAAEEFTMVIPNLKPSRSVDPVPSHQVSIAFGTTSSPGMANLGDPFTYNEANVTPTTSSPKKQSGPNGSTWSNNQKGGGIPRLSPSKLAGDFDGLSLNGEKAQRISPSPKSIGSRKEKNLTPKNLSYTQGSRPLLVYEDPVRDSANGSPFPAPRTHTPRALEELPVNEPTKQHRGVFDHLLLAEEPNGPEYHQKWLAIEAEEKRRTSTQENFDNPRLARKILDSAIERVCARTLDVHGFRKLQALIRTSGDSIWDGGYKFDELILPLFEYLETPNDDSTHRSVKAQDLKTQVLVTVRLLLQHQPRYFSTYYPRALTAVLATRKHYNSTSHIVCGLEETAESIVHQCNPLPCIDSVLDLLETEHSRGAGAESNTIFMSLYVLAGLLHRGQEKDSTIQLSEEQQQRLGNLGSRFLTDTNPDIRRAVMEFVLELHDSVDERSFWALVTGKSEESRSLITYYLARKRAVIQ